MLVRELADIAEHGLCEVGSFCPTPAAISMRLAQNLEEVTRDAASDKIRKPGCFNKIVRLFDLNPEGFETRRSDLPSDSTACDRLQPRRV
jgi:hypothetical protein